MNKLKLNKKTIAQMDRVEMNTVKGGINIGICLHSCPNGSRKSKNCCGVEAVHDCLDAGIR